MDRRPQWIKAYLNDTPGQGAVGPYVYFGACGVVNPARAATFFEYYSTAGLYIAPEFFVNFPDPPTLLNGDPAGLNVADFGYVDGAYVMNGWPQRPPIYQREDFRIIQAPVGDSISSDGARKAFLSTGVIDTFYTNHNSNPQWISVNFADNPAYIGKYLYFVPPVESEVIALNAGEFWFDPPLAPDVVDPQAPMPGGGASGGNSDGGFAGYTPPAFDQTQNFYQDPNPKIEREITKVETAIIPPSDKGKKPKYKSSHIFGGAVIWFFVLYALTKK